MSANKQTGRYASTLAAREPPDSCPDSGSSRADVLKCSMFDARIIRNCGVHGFPASLQICSCCACGRTP
eukprot:2403568-Alexandrium_andersonii.AAC.1